MTIITSLKNIARQKPSLCFLRHVLKKIIGTKIYDQCRSRALLDLSSMRYYSWLMSADGRKNQKSLLSLKGSCTGKRCFIIGNGPSLKEMNLSFLDGEITIASNAFFLAFDKIKWRPHYYTVEDVLVAEDRGDAISNLQNTTKIAPIDIRHYIRPDINTCYVNFARQYPRFANFTRDFARIVYWGGTVTYFNIQLGVYLGCNPIYLIGVDHSYKTDFRMEKKGNMWKSLEGDPNHFDPSYFGRGYRWHDPNLERMETAYREALRYCCSSGITIQNATVGGKLEIFKRVDFETII